MLPNLKFHTAALAVLFLSLSAPAQIVVSTAQPAGNGVNVVSVKNVPPVMSSMKLKPGQSVKGKDGRTIKNTAAKGTLTIHYRGKIDRGTNNPILIDGPITNVTVPASGGSRKWEAKTNGKKTTITVKRNGTSTSKGTWSVDGGKATITISSNHNNYNVGGKDNNVTVNGNDNNGTGKDANSSGTITHNRSARRNGFASNGGNWNFRT